MRTHEYLESLKELWIRQKEDPEVRLTYQYVMELQDRLHETCELAKQELLKAQCKQKKYYDVKSKERMFLPGHKVLILLPSDNNKLKPVSLLVNATAVCC